MILKHCVILLCGGDKRTADMDVVLIINKNSERVCKTNVYTHIRKDGRVNRALNQPVDLCNDSSDPT